MSTLVHDLLSSDAKLRGFCLSIMWIVNVLSIGDVFMGPAMLKSIPLGKKYNRKSLYGGCYILLLG